MNGHGHASVDRHILEFVIACLFLLALVMLISVGGPLLQVMAVRSISYPLILVLVADWLLVV